MKEASVAIKSINCVREKGRKKDEREREGERENKFEERHNFH